jgi:hypothetical protein
MLTDCLWGKGRTGHHESHQASLVPPEIVTGDKSIWPQIMGLSLGEDASMVDDARNTLDLSDYIHPPQYTRQIRSHVYQIIHRDWW